MQQCVSSKWWRWHCDLGADRNWEINKWNKNSHRFPSKEMHMYVCKGVWKTKEDFNNYKILIINSKICVCKNSWNPHQRHSDIVFVLIVEHCFLVGHLLKVRDKPTPPALTLISLCPDSSWPRIQSLIDNEV